MRTIPPSRPESPNKTILPQARRYVERGQYDRALAEYEACIDTAGDDVRVWMRIADVQMKRKDKEAAAIAFEKIAQLYSQQGFYNKALAYYIQLRTLRPNDLGVVYAIVDIYQHLLLPAEARRMLDLAMAHLRQSGNNEECLAIGQKVVELFPDDPKAHLELGEAYRRSGCQRLAAAAYLRGAELLGAEGRIEEYIRAAERALECEPTLRGPAKTLAKLYLMRAEPTRAALALRACYERDPRDCEILEILGDAFEALGQREKARSLFQVMAEQYERVRDFDKRDEAHRRILKIDPSDLVACAAMGWGQAWQAELVAEPVRYYR